MSKFDTHHITVVQKEVTEKVYEDVKDIIQEIIADPDITDVFSIVHLVCTIAGSLELYTINDTKLSGRDKKEILLELGTIIVEENISDDLENSFKTIYYKTVEDTLEILIKFAKNNKVLKRVSKMKSPCDYCL